LEDTAGSSRAIRVGDELRAGGELTLEARVRPGDRRIEGDVAVVGAVEAQSSLRLARRELARLRDGEPDAIAGGDDRAGTDGEVEGRVDLADIRIVVSTVEASNAELRGDPRRLAGEGDAGGVRDRPTRLGVDRGRADHS
jgi:hypothetical protein